MKLFQVSFRKKMSLNKQQSDLLLFHDFNHCQIEYYKTKKKN